MCVVVVVCVCESGECVCGSGECGVGVFECLGANGCVVVAVRDVRVVCRCVGGCVGVCVCEYVGI